MFSPSETKLGELIIYIADECSNQRFFGATKLNKILFFADFLSYQQFGSSITESEYMKLPKGPVPRVLVRVRNALIAAGDIAVREETVIGGKTQKRIVHLRNANLELFSAQQIKLVDDVIATLSNSTAKTVSDLSHRFIGWELAKERETIPYKIALFDSKTLSKKQIVAISSSLDKAEVLARQVLNR